jgi:hypothetical protein
MRSVVHASAFIALGALVTVGCSAAPADDAAASSEAAQIKAGTTRIVLGGETDSEARSVALAFDAALSASGFGAGAAGHVFVRVDDVSCGGDGRYCSFDIRDDAGRKATIADAAGKAQQLYAAVGAVGETDAGMNQGHASADSASCESSLKCTVNGVVHTGFAASRLKATLDAVGATHGASRVRCTMHMNPFGPASPLDGVPTYECDLDPRGPTGASLPTAHVEDAAPIAAQIWNALKHAGVLPATKTFGGSHPTSTTTIKASAVDCRSAAPEIGGTSTCTLVVPDCATAGCGEGFECCGAVHPTCVPAGSRCGL